MQNAIFSFRNLIKHFDVFAGASDFVAIGAIDFVSIDNVAFWMCPVWTGLRCRYKEAPNNTNITTLDAHSVAFDTDVSQRTVNTALVGLEGFLRGKLPDLSLNC